jgi:hypothetical protein
MENGEWKWWSGHDEENFALGPFDTRQEAIDAAQHDACGEFQDVDDVWKVGVHLVEARKDPLRLADFIDVEGMLERAEESVSDSDRASEYDDPPYFEITPAQESALTERIKTICDEWQAQFGIRPETYTFSAMRNSEYVVVPHPNDKASS